MLVLQGVSIGSVVWGTIAAIVGGIPGAAVGTRRREVRGLGMAGGMAGAMASGGTVIATERLGNELTGFGAIVRA